LHIQKTSGLFRGLALTSQPEKFKLSKSFSLHVKNGHPKEPSCSWTCKQANQNFKANFAVNIFKYINIYKYNFWFRVTDAKTCIR